MLSLKSIRGRSILAGLALLLLLAGVGAVSVWRAQSERGARASLERRALAVSALETQRAQVFTIGTYTAMSAIADDPSVFVDLYHENEVPATEAIQNALDSVAATGDDVSALSEMAVGAEKMLQDADAVLAAYQGASPEERRLLTQDAMATLWPQAAPMVVQLDQAIQEQQSKLSAEQQAANRSSDETLALLIALSALAFVVASGILVTFILTLVRPLASLQASARAIISGDLQARAPESGPEEVVSVARDVNEMTQALLDRTERLVKSEQRFRDVLDVSRDVVYKLNMETRTYDYISPSTFQLLGFTPEEVVEMALDGVWARFHPDDAAALAMPSAASSAANGRETPSIEYRWRFKDGDYRWLSDDRTFVRDDEGKLHAVVGTVRDITQRKAAEEALRDSEERFRSLSASAPVGIFSIDTEGKFTYGNQYLLDTFGIDVDALLERRWHFGIHPDDRKAAIAAGMEKVPERGTFSREYRILRADGAVRWVRTISNPLLNKDGNVTSYVGAVEDITERRQAEDALRESEERFRTLCASAPVGIFLMDRQGQVTYGNERLQAISGVSRQGGPVGELALVVHPDDREQLLQAWAEAGREKGEFTAEYRILTPAGDTRWVRTNVSRLASSSDGEGGIVGTVEDVTSQKAAEEGMKHRIEVESAVAHASNLLASSEDLDAALNLAMRILGTAFGADRGHLFVLDGKTRMHCIGAWCSPDASEAKNAYDFDAISFPWSTRIMLQGEPIIVNNIAEMPPEAAAEKSLWESLNIKSIVAVPLISRGRITGTIMLDTSCSTCVWREEDVRLLRLAAESTSSFIDRQRAGEERHQAYESIIFLLATAAEARDPYTENHLQRVRGYTESIALELGLTQEEATEIALVALLHDLGKIRVPDSILIKPGPLSEEEWQTMRKHTVWGEELLPDDPWFKTAREISRWHHESWDGTGYPDGLHGDMIPLHTAIVAVADGFDAMTSRRPYKAPWPPIRAIREITKQKGKRYSPVVVDAFRRAVEKGDIDRAVASRGHNPKGLKRAA